MSWPIATRKMPANTSLNAAASSEMILLTGLNTRYSAQATTTSSVITKNRLTMPSRNSPADSVMSLAVCAAFPCVTSPSTATKLPKPASTDMTRIPTPAVMLA